jgi:hypothetical protein
MSEKRKPKYKMLLQISGKGKTHKLELFEASDWGVNKRLFRMRYDGKWFPAGKRRFFTKTEVKEITFRGIKA